MKVDFKGLLEGIKNKYFPPKEMREKIEETSKERLNICKGCLYYSLNTEYTGPRPDIHCLNCGCNLDFKTKCLSCSCPQDKWQAVLSEKEEKEMVEVLNQTNES